MHEVEIIDTVGAAGGITSLAAFSSSVCFCGLARSSLNCFPAASTPRTVSLLRLNEIRTSKHLLLDAFQDRRESLVGRKKLNYLQVRYTSRVAGLNFSTSCS
jgi:hypothetical protein